MKNKRFLALFLAIVSIISIFSFSINSYADSTEKVTLCTGKSTQFVVNNAKSWWSDNPAIASISNDGVVVAKSEGVAWIYCTTSTLNTKMYIVTVKQHNYVYSYAVEPTCTNAGYDVLKCDNCADELNNNVLNPTGHKYEKKVKKPTYYAGGYTLNKCVKCSYSYKNNKKNKLTLGVPSLTLKNTKKSISVSWKKVKGSTGYQIQVGTDSKFKKSKKINYENNSSSKIKMSVSKAMLRQYGIRTKCYIRIRTYYSESGKKTVYSKWSKVKSVTIK